MMNALERHLSKLDNNLYLKFQETKVEVKGLLQIYSANFPTYTDHSIDHTWAVFKIAAELVSEEETESLNGDESYILAMACILHDVGMCIPEEKLTIISQSEEILLYKKSHPNFPYPQCLLKKPLAKARTCGNQNILVIKNLTIIDKVVKS